MTNSFTFPLKNLLLVFFCSTCFLIASAQQRNERHDRDDRPGRTPSSGNHEPRYEQVPQRNNGDANRPQVYSPRRENHLQSIIHPDADLARGSHFTHVDRNFRIERTHAMASSGYESYHDRYHYNSRPPVYSAHNPCWRYEYLPARRTVITSFPFGYQTINFAGCGYRFYNGVFYRPFNNAFVVVAPPIGLFINVLPFGYRRIFVNDYPYYYYNGTYYDGYENNYRVVAPPVGAVVESIPQGYETIVIDGETYYKVDGIQYKPVVQDNGEIWYQVIKVN